MDTGVSLADIAAVTDKSADGMFGAGAGGGMWIFALLILLLIGNGGFGGLGGANALSQADLQRAVDLNSIQEGQASINANVQRVAYENMVAVKDAQLTNLQEIRDNGALISAGNSNIINNLTALSGAVQQCCCDLKSTVMENRYLDAQNTSAIMTNDTANTQKILDAISTNRIADMQNQINALQMQNAMSGVVRYPMQSTYCSGSNPFCGSACGCGSI